MRAQGASSEFSSSIAKFRRDTKAKVRVRQRGCYLRLLILNGTHIDNSRTPRIIELNEVPGILEERIRRRNDPRERAYSLRRSYETIQIQ